MTMELTQYQGENVSGLVRLAIEQNVSVEMLERLVALQERVTERDARAAFFKSLTDFQAAVPPIPKTGKIPDNNGNVRSTFAPLPVIAETIREPLSKHGLSYSWRSEDDGEFVTVICTLRHVDGHSESASFKCRIRDAAAPKMSGVQISGSAHSYGMRYSLIQVLGLTTADEDTDGSGAGPEFLNEDQADQLDSLMNEVKVNRPKFLEVLGVKSISEVTVDKLPYAIRLLEEKRRRG